MAAALDPIGRLLGVKSFEMTSAGWAGYWLFVLVLQAVIGLISRLTE